MNPHFDGSVTLGNVITVISVIVSLVIFWVRTEARIGVVEKWIDKHEKDMIHRVTTLDELKQIITRLTTIAETVERRLSRLEKE